MAKKSKPTTMSRGDARDKLIDAALYVAARDGWRRLTMFAVADVAGMTPGEALTHFRHKQSLLAGFVARIDNQMLDASRTPMPDETPRDRLFDALMRRFDALQPHRKAVGRIVRDLPSLPLSAACHLKSLHRSMCLTLEACGIGANGCAGQLRAKGLGGVYANALRVWLDDDSEDLAATMAALDRGLMSAERLAAILWPSEAPTTRD